VQAADQDILDAVLLRQGDYGAYGNGCRHKA
jgi:hypothetical protein